MEELESLTKRIIDIRDAALQEGLMSSAPWNGEVRDYMCAVASRDVENVQIGCSACYGPLPADKRDTPKCPYCSSPRSEWPVQEGVPAEVLMMYVEAERLGKRAQQASVTRSMLVVVALSAFLVVIGVWPVAGLVLLGGVFISAGLGGSAKGAANVPYFNQVWRAYRRNNNRELSADDREDSEPMPPLDSRP